MPPSEPLRRQPAELGPPLGMPLQVPMAIDWVSRDHAYPQGVSDVNFNPCGQIIGTATTVRRAGDVVLGIVDDYIEAVEPLQLVNEGATTV
jgi:hypothetical protein